MTDTEYMQIALDEAQKASSIKTSYSLLTTTAAKPPSTPQATQKSMSSAPPPIFFPNGV